MQQQHVISWQSFKKKESEWGSGRSKRTLANTT